MRSNPIALAMANYVRTVDNTFGLLSDPRASVSTMVNDCIVCDTRERMRAEGRKAWSVSTSGQPLCADCNYERMMEMMD
jgi:hypothetical protein